MLFNSLQFAIFFPVVFALYWSLPEKFRVYIILVSSYYFYMSWNAKYVVLILFTTIVSYFAAIMLEKFRLARKLILVITLLSCLGVLFVFKYFNFISETLVNFLNMFASIKLHPVTLKLLLPVGISFYTFQTLSYVIDVYKGQEKAEKNFAAYAAFISFFPQLVAGPIERTKNLLPQIKGSHVFKYEQGVYGLKLILWGLFKKMAVADYLAVWVDKIFANVEAYRGFVLIIAVCFFAVQIYCDFSGYTDIARGCAKLMGIELMVNFRSPYFASSIREYWQRWHISLSTWFRDYVYIPLGGSRVSKIKHYRNIMIVFMTSGFWHGANWTYIIWGMLHGIASIIEKLLSRRDKNYRPKGLEWAVKVLITFTFCVFSRIFYRAANLQESLYICRHLFDGITSIKSYLYNGIRDLKSIQGETKFAAIFIITLAVWDYISLETDIISWTSKLGTFKRWALYAVLTFLAIISIFSGARNPAEFIYFQF